MQKMDFTGAKIAVLGVGEAGQAAARWLHSRGAELLCCDTLAVNEWSPEFLEWCRASGIRLLCEDDMDTQDVPSCQFAVVSPGIPPIARMVRSFMKRGVPVIGELALSASLWKGRLIGITGTNGKTTTTALTAHLLSSAGIPNVKAGNISPPLFECMSQKSEDMTAVLEISSFQLEYFPGDWPDGLIKPRFSTACILNIAPDHIDRHGNTMEYARCKLRLLEYQGPGDMAVLGPVGQVSMPDMDADIFMLRPSERHGHGAHMDIAGSCLAIVWPGGAREEYDLSGWRLYGRHNLENLAAAIVAARHAGAGHDAVQNGINIFQAPAYRLQNSGTWRGIRFINDSKATNVAALIAALESVQGDVTLIAGGRGKGEEFSRIAEFVRAGSSNGYKGGMLKSAVLIGEEAERMASVMQGIGVKTKVLSGTDGEKTIQEAVRIAVAMSRPGDIVLLSPACASFDMFSSYRQRGKAFDNAVKILADGVFNA